MDEIYREMLQVALAHLHEAQQTEAVLTRRLEALHEELRRYIRQAVPEQEPEADETP